jgi:hypothetical protein
MFLCRDVLKGQHVILIKWENFGAFLSWLLRREIFLTGDSINKFYCTSIQFSHIQDDSDLMLWLQVLTSEVILSQKCHVNFVKELRVMHHMKVKENENKQRSFIVKYTTLFERTNCSFSSQPGMPVNWVHSVCQSIRFVLWMDSSIHCDEAVCLACAPQTKV